MNVFLEIMNTLSAELHKWSKPYREISERFEFFCRLKTISLEDLKKKCTDFAAFYHEDVACEDLEIECIHLGQYLKKIESVSNEISTIAQLYKVLVKDNLKESFPNVEIALRIFLVMLITNISGERSFSKLKRLENELRTCQTQERLSYLSLMNIEREILIELDFTEIIADFVNAKCRKKPFSTNL